MKEEVKKMLEPLPRLLFTVPEVAAILGVNENMVHDLRKAGLLKAMKLGRYKIRKSTLEAFLVQYDGQDIGEILSETAV
jgi:excisionase family DNA binding protein